MNRQKRITITLKLLPGKDDDLITWWLSLSIGSRQGLLKSMLRTYMREKAGQKDDATWMREALAALPDYLEQIIARVAAAPPERRDDTARANGPDGALSTEAINRREHKIARTRW
jgi:hypothetical protein